MVRNAERQSLEVALPAGAKFVTARVRGEAVRPLLTGAGRLQVPLVRSTEPFEVAIVYEEPLDAAGGTATLRAPDLGLPGGLARWTVRLPDGSVAKARDVSGVDNLLFRRNSQTGAIECLSNRAAIALNEALHAN